LKESYERFSWTDEDDPTLFRFCRVIGNIAKLEQPKSKFFASNLSNIPELILDTSTETETIVVTIRAIRNLANNSSSNVRILFNVKLIPKLAGKLVSNPNPALNHHLVITLEKIISLLRSLSKNVINNPHDEFIKRK
jgi:hypothetical protein